MSQVIVVEIGGPRGDLPVNRLNATRENSKCHATDRDAKGG
jgi:hypothetical protein